MLTRDEILKPRPRHLQPVPTPEWAEGSKVNVKLLTTGEFLAMTAMEKRHPNSGAAMWLINCVTDESGVNLFTEADVDAFTEQPISVVNRLVAAAQSLNFRNTDDLLKNSVPTQSAA